MSFVSIRRNPDPAELIGTPGFMSPEQHAGQWEKVGPASDIYSLGATLYVLLTGKSPFEGRSPEEIAAKVKQGDFIPPCRMNPDVPRARSGLPQGDGARARASL